MRSFCPSVVLVPAGLGVAFAACLGLAGCGTNPSFAVRWMVNERASDADPDDADPHPDWLDRAIECSRVGVSLIGIQTFGEFGLVDAREEPCFPGSFERQSAVANGPSLPPGRYAVVVQGLRRNETPWVDDETIFPDGETDGPLCVEGDPPRCRLDQLVCDCRFIEVEDGRTARVTDLVLEPPPECIDGIDGDRDGLVDASDPGCRIAQSEAARVSTVQFRLLVTVLGENASAVCSSAGIAAFSVMIDDTELEPFACRLGAPLLFSADLDAGDHVVSVAAVGATGTAITMAAQETFSVAIDGGTSINIELDLDGSDFLEPLVASSPITLAFVDEQGEQGRGCVAPGEPNIDSVRITVVDGHGGTITPPVALTDGTPLDGSDLPCPAATLRTMPLAWGSYAAYIEGLSGGAVCYASDAPIALAPNDSRVLEIPRVANAPAACPP